MNSICFRSQKMKGSKAWNVIYEGDDPFIVRMQQGWYFTWISVNKVKDICSLFRWSREFLLISFTQQPRHREEVLGGVREGIPLSLALACQCTFLEQCPRWWCHRSYNLLSCREWTLLSGVIRNNHNQWSEVLGNKAEAVLPNIPDCPRSWFYQWFHIENPDESKLSPIASGVQLLGHTILLLK